MIKKQEKKQAKEMRVKREEGERERESR